MQNQRLQLQFLSSWWWAVCRSKHVEQLRNIGIINSTARSHLVDYFYKIFTVLFLFVLNLVYCSPAIKITDWNNSPKLARNTYHVLLNTVRLKVFHTAVQELQSYKRVMLLDGFRCTTIEGLVSKKYQIQKIQNLCNRWCYMSWPSSTFCS
jgi:hypothetical protein